MQPLPVNISRPGPTRRRSPLHLQGYFLNHCGLKYSFFFSFLFLAFLFYFFSDGFSSAPANHRRNRLDSFLGQKVIMDFSGRFLVPVAIEIQVVLSIHAVLIAGALISLFF